MSPAPSSNFFTSREDPARRRSSSPLASMATLATGHRNVNQTRDSRIWQPSTLSSPKQGYPFPYPNHTLKHAPVCYPNLLFWSLLNYPTLPRPDFTTALWNFPFSFQGSHKVTHWPAFNPSQSPRILCVCVASASMSPLPWTTEIPIFDFLHLS